VLLSLNAKSLNICDRWEITNPMVSFQLEPIVAIATFIYKPHSPSNRRSFLPTPHPAHFLASKHSLTTFIFLSQAISIFDIALSYNSVFEFT
jgi:hypothetical protein